MNYTIGEVANLLDTNASTIRYYDKEGLLPTVERDRGGARKFNEEDISFLRLIQCLKASGMTIKDIKQFVDWTIDGDETIKQRQKMFHKQKERVEEEMARLQHSLDMVNYKCWFYDTAVKLGHTNIGCVDMLDDVAIDHERSGVFKTIDIEQ